MIGYKKKQFGSSSFKSAINDKRKNFSATNIQLMGNDNLDSIVKT
jgi:hypothetical protein